MTIQVKARVWLVAIGYVSLFLSGVNAHGAQEKSVSLPSPGSMQDAAQWKERTGTWSGAASGHAVRGLSGVFLSKSEMPADFSLTIQLRYDELRFFARPPFSGIAFHVQDQRNYDALVLTDFECQLAWKQVRDGQEKVVAKSSDGLYTEVGKPFWMRLTVANGELQGALSLDGKAWKTVLHAPMPQHGGEGRAGLVAGAPATWFTWGEDAKVPLPAYVPYSYEAERTKPVDVPRAPVKSDYLQALKKLQTLPLAPGDSLQEAGLSSVRAWQVTNDDAWKKRAIVDAKKMIAEFSRSGTAPIGFAAFYQEMTTLQAAMQNGWLTPEERAVVPKIAADALLRGQYERGPMNRALGNLVGIKPALALDPEFPQRAQVEKIVTLVEGDFAEYGYAPVEDASDYIKVSLIFAAIHALESRPDWWQQKGFHDVFANFAAEISPLGRFPGFGDDDDADAPELMGLVELAAAKWGDPVFHEAARRLWSVSYGGGFPKSVKSSEITSVALAATYATDGPGAAPLQEPPVHVYYRANGTPSKAVMRNGSTWMMVDLFAGGEHGHNDSLAITTLESDGTVQLEDNGRYARGMMFHNRPQFTEHAVDFPLWHDLAEQTRRVRQQYFTNGEWTHYHLPLHDHWIWGNFAGDVGLPTLQRDAYNPEIPASLSYDPAKQTALILDMSGYGHARISLADVQINGPDGSRPLQLSIPANAPPAKLEHGAHDGKDAYVWDTALGENDLFVGGLAAGSTDAAAAKNTWVDFWLKLEPVGDSRVAINSFAVGDHDGYPKRFLDAYSPNGTITVETTEVVDGGAHFVADEKMISQANEPIVFTRDIFQATPGFTWVRDRMENQGAQTGTAGVVWYGVQPVAAGKDSYQFATGLKIAISGAETTGIEQKRSYGMRDQAIAYGSLKLKGYADETVDSFLITDHAAWHRVDVPTGAVVWSDGVHWVGRNPAGDSLHFDGFTTSRKLFVLTRETAK